MDAHHCVGNGPDAVANELSAVLVKLNRIDGCISVCGDCAKKGGLTTGPRAHIEPPLLVAHSAGSRTRERQRCKLRALVLNSCGSRRDRRDVGHVAASRADTERRQARRRSTRLLNERIASNEARPCHERDTCWGVVRIKQRLDVAAAPPCGE